MRKIIIYLLLIITTCSLCACNNKKKEVKIDYGESKIYSKKDMDSAIKLLKEKFKEFEGCELHSIKYSSDDVITKDNLDWLNGIRPEEYKDIKFTQIIMFETDFHTPKGNNCCFTEDIEMEDYEWWFARTDNGEWVYITKGY